MKNLIFLLAVLSIIWVSAQPSHTTFDLLLQKHVTSAGKVNYKGFKAEVDKLDDYLNTIKENKPSSEWTSKAIKAYWINAYNAFTIKLMLNHYPLKSITDLKFSGKSAWDYSWIKIGGETLSLNDIEHKKLRAKYKDPRIHFAVNCASYSCPILANKAYTEENASSLMSKQASRFINDSTRNKVSATEVKISEIFKWYADDFKTKGSIIDYLNKYSKIKINANATISYLSYNWKINE